MNIVSQAVIPLLQSVVDPDEYQRKAEVFFDLLEARGVVINDDHPSYVPLQYVREGPDAAKSAFLRIYTGDLYILSFAWNQFKRVPWAEVLRNDPAVMEVMAERELRLKEIREEVIEMMEEPEWREL